MEPSTKNELVDAAAAAHHLAQQLQQLQQTDKTMSRKVNDLEDHKKPSSPVQASAQDSQSTTDGHDVASTPLTSASEFSSQSTNSESHLSSLSQLSQLAAAQQHLNNAGPTRPNVSIPSTAGHKRTANGHLKSASPTSSPEKRQGHSRNTSAVSAVSSVGSSRIGELSSDLRMRLSYAMIKVNNGWQTNTIDEVETLASQAGSPTSSSSTLQGRRNQIASPRAAIASMQGPSSSIPAVPQQATPDFDLYSRNDVPSRTYESFWRDHSTNTSVPAQRTALPHAPVISHPSNPLGPPADIRPTPISRRSGTPKFSKPPTIPSHGSNSPYNAPGPRTPHRIETRDKIPMQSSQKTLQEQDAIESLLFMSSPGNSGNMNHVFPPPKSHGSPQQSPLRAEFHNMNRVAQGRRVEFDATATSGSTASSEAGGQEYRHQARRKSHATERLRGKALDRLLDEMEDSSSDDEELPLNAYNSPRRLNAGTV